MCFPTALEVFYITPEKPAPKEKVLDENGEEVPEEAAEGEEDPEELAKKYAPKF